MKGILLSHKQKQQSMKPSAFDLKCTFISL